jgi:hypothetical protein
MQQLKGEDLTRNRAKRAMWTWDGPESKQGSRALANSAAGIPSTARRVLFPRSTASCRFMGEGTHRIHRPRAQQASKGKSFIKDLASGPSNRGDRKRRVVQKEEIKRARTPNSRRPSLGVVRSPTSAGRAHWK